MRKGAQKVDTGRPRRRCQLMDELRDAARNGYGSPVYGHVPQAEKRMPMRRRGG